jgi:hypothetical protein
MNLINNVMAWNNLNLCFSVTDSFTTSLAKLSSFNCSEVIVLNLGSNPLKVWDNGSLLNPAPSALCCFVVPPSAEMTFRGLTNSNQVSAAFVAGAGLVSYRTQFFSSFPMTVY